MANEKFVFEADLLLHTNGDQFVRELRGIFQQIREQAQGLLSQGSQTAAAGIPSLYTAALGQAQAFIGAKPGLSARQLELAAGVIRGAESTYARLQAQGAAQGTPFGGLGSLAQAQQRGAALIQQALEAQNRRLLAERLAATSTQQQAGVIQQTTATARAVGQATQQQLQAARAAAGAGRAVVDPRAVRNLTQAQQQAFLSGLTGTPVQDLQVLYRTEAQRQRAGLNRRLAADEDYVRAEQDATRALQQRKTAVSRAGTTEPFLNVPPAQQATLIQALSQFGGGKAGISTASAQAALATALETEAFSVRAATARQQVGDREWLEARARATLAERQRAIAVAQATRQEAEAQGIAGGTFFQRLQAQIHARSSQTDSRLPSDFQTLGQFFTSKALTTLGFAASGAILYGTINGFREIIREASALQRELAVIKSQFDTLGDSAGFEEFSRKVVDISVQTGVVADQVALVARQLSGVFRDAANRDIPDFNKALEQTSVALKLSQVTGLPVQEITDSLTSITTTFGDSFDKIGDLSIGLERRFGVLAPQIIEFTADVAPVAKELGFTVDQISALGAIAQQRSGVSGGALAESFNRALPAIQQTQVGLAQLLGQRNQTQGFIEPLISAISGARGAEAITILTQAYKEMTQAQRQALGELLGGQRNAKAFFAVLQGGQDTIDALNGDVGDFTGSLDDRFKDFQSTIEFVFERARRAFEQFGLALFNSGIADGLKLIADSAALAASAAGELLKMFSDFNDSLGGLPIKLLSVYAALRLISGVVGGLGGLRALIAGISARGAAGGAVSPAVASGQLFGFAPPAAATGANQFRLGIPLGRAGTAAAGVPGVTGLSSFVAALGPAIVATSIASVVQTVVDLQHQADAARDDLIKSVQDGLAKGLTQEEILRRAKEAGGDEEVGTTFAGFLIPGLPTTTATGEILDQFQRDNSARQIEEVKAIIAKASKEQQRALSEKLLQSFGLKGDELQQALRDEERNGGLQQLLDRFTKDPTNDQANDAVARLIEIAASGGLSPEAAAALAEIALKYQTAAQESLQQQAVTDYAPVLEEVKARYDIGNATLSEVAAAERHNIEILKLALESMTGEARAKGAQELAAAQKELDQTLTQAANRATSIQSKLATARGDNINAATTASKLAGLQSIIEQGGSPDAQLDAALDVLDSLGSQLTEFINSPVIQNGIARAPTAAEKLARAAKGIQIPPEVRTTIIKAQLSMGTIGNALKAAATASGQDFFDLLNTLATAIEAGDQQAVDGLKATMAAQITKLQGLRQFIVRLGESTAKIDQAIADLYNGIASLNNTTKIDPGPTYHGDTTDLGNQAAIDASTEAKALADALIAQQRARAHGDPIATAQAAIASAYNAIRYASKPSERAAAVAQLIEAQNQLEDAEKSRIEAYYALGEAMTSDPVLKARYELDKATYLISQAHGAQAQYEAMARQVEAQRTLQEAIVDVFRSQQELVAAMAEAAGDTVAATKAQLTIAQANLQELLNRAAAGDDPGEAAINRARAEVVRAQAAVRDADLQKREQAIDTALQLEKITTQQAIAQFEALLQIPNLTAEQTNEILLKIKQLQQQLNQDLQFNIPGEIKLPTIYQVRRLAEGGYTPGGPTTLTDNRVFHLFEGASLNAGDPKQVQEAVDAITSAVSAPPRNGLYQNPIGA